MNKRKIIALISVLAMVMACFAGCGSDDSGTAKDTEKGKLKIVVTGFPEYDLTRAVVGDKADIKMLLKPGAESHSFEPSPEDIVNIKNADLFIYGGGESDEWIDDVLDSMDTDDAKKQKVLTLMSMVKTLEEEMVEGMEEHDHHHDHDSDKHDEHDHDSDKHDEHDHDSDKEDKHEHDHDDADKHDEDEPEYDEHVWTSPVNAIDIINKINAAVVKLDVKNRDAYENNATKYIEKLEALDKEFKNTVKNAKRKTVVFGDRFPLRYFVEEYGLKYYAAFPGCAAQTEPSAATVAFLINKVKQEKIPVIFKIELSNGNVANAVANATKSKVMTFNSCHNVTVEQFKSGVTYIDLMKENLKALKTALN